MNPTLESLMRTIWGMIALTTIVFLVRGIIRFKSSHRIAVADCVLLLAYLCFLALAILYLETIGAMYRWQSALSGETPVYPEYASDLVIMRKAMLINAYLLWCTLWSVKFAFLALYWRLVQQQPRFVKIWWAICIFVVLAFIGNIPAHLVSCRKLDFFDPKGCTSREDQMGQLISLYYSFSADVATDLAVMFLPLIVIRKLQIPRAKKIGIAVLFSIGWICIAVAIVRVIKLGEGKGQFIPGWLALWGTIEASIAVVVGCGPGLYISAKEAYDTHVASSHTTEGSKTNRAHSGRRWSGDTASEGKWLRVDENMENKSGDIKVESQFEMRTITSKDIEGDDELLYRTDWPLDNSSTHTRKTSTTLGELRSAHYWDWSKSPPPNQRTVITTRGFEAT